MTKLRQQEEAFFNSAKLLLDPAQRAAFLEAACADDPELRRRIDALLSVEPEADDFFGNPPTVAISAQRASPPIPANLPIHGDQMGRYKLLQKLGEGGCGEVWMAEQKEPVKRRVALKIIKLGMDTKQVVARFEAERQALALMDHPNIAKVLDGGATENGRPYFVMELVRGIRITDYCTKNELPTRARLELFIKVCQALQHAHQKGIIHRDIKPANILVTLHDGIPVPKVIDFGIAKTTQQELTDKTVFTQLNQFVGTPAYMSPEQAEMSGLDIDTRTDIYSLGVLLYELLIGQTPFTSNELLAQGIDGMRKTIREKEPIRPSTRLSQTLLNAPESAAAAEADGQASSRRLAKTKETISLLRGDLDWIVMKCLEKDRSRRYETANGLAMDIQRHLNFEPVIARPPSTLYRFNRLARRNKAAFAAAVSVFLALVLGTIVSVWQAIRATRAEHEQERQRVIAQTNERKAQQSRANEARERAAAQKAHQQEAALRRRAEAEAYVADMNLARQALDLSNLGRVRELLDRHRPARNPALPAETQPDRRGWEWRYLWQYCQNDAQDLLIQRSNSITSLSVSPDKRKLAIGDKGGGLCTWDLLEHREIHRFPGGDGAVATAFSPDGDFLAFTLESRASRSITACIWSDFEQRVVTRLPLNNECPLLAFSQDGHELATFTQRGDAQVTIWRVPEGTKLRQFPLLPFRASPGRPLAVTEDLRFAAQAVAGAADTGRLRVFDLQTGADLWNHQAGDTYLAALAFSPDGKTLASAEGAGKTAIYLWDVQTGRAIGRLDGHRAYSLSLEFSADGHVLVSGSADQTVRLWNWAEGVSIATLRGHKLEVWRTGLPGANQIVSGGKDGSVLLWDTSRSRPQPVPFTFPVPVRAWCFAPDSRSILTLETQAVTRWIGPTFRHREVVLPIVPLLNSPQAMLLSKFSPDGTMVAVRESKAVKVWDLSQRKLLCQVDSEGGPVAPWLFLPGERKILLAKTEANSMHEYDLNTGREARSWKFPAARRVSASFPDESWCLELGFGEDSPLNSFVTHARRSGGGCAPTDALAVSADGKFAATLSSFDVIKLRETRELKVLNEFQSMLMGAHSVGFSPDGNRLVAGSVGLEGIKLWDLESRHEVLTLEALDQPQKHLSTAFSPDGNLLAAMNRLGILHVWRAPSWEEIKKAETTRQNGRTNQ